METPSGQEPSLYDVLGVSRDAKRSEILKAARLLSGKYHPDRPSGNRAKFEEVQKARDVLSDDRKRMIYDLTGGRGGQLLHNAEELAPSWFLNFALFLARSRIVLTLAWALIFVESIIIPVFIIAKVDGIVTWDWAIVFVPIWLLFAALLVMLGVLWWVYFKSFSTFGNRTSRYSDADATGADSEERTPFNPSAAGADDEFHSQQQQQQQQQQDEQQSHMPRRDLPFFPLLVVRALLLLTFFVLLTVQASGALASVELAAVAVFAPLYAMSALGFIATVFEIRSDRLDRAYIARAFACGRSLAAMTVMRLVHWLLPALTLTLISLQAAGAIAVSYWVVLTPLLVNMSLTFALNMADCCRSTDASGINDELLAVRVGLSQVGSALVALVTPFFLVCVCLAAAKLDNPLAFSAAIVFVPYFVLVPLLLIVLGVCTLAVAFVTHNEIHGAGGSGSGDSDGFGEGPYGSGGRTPPTRQQTRARTDDSDGEGGDNAYAEPAQAAMLVNYRGPLTQS